MPELPRSPEEVTRENDAIDQAFAQIREMPYMREKDMKNKLQAYSPLSTEELTAKREELIKEMEHDKDEFSPFSPRGRDLWAINTLIAQREKKQEPK